LVFPATSRRSGGYRCSNARSSSACENDNPSAFTGGVPAEYDLLPAASFI
jgi:hypothetical protein